MTQFTPKKQQQFLDVLREGNSVATAAAAVGITRQAAYKLRRADDDFAAEWETAIEVGTDHLEDEAVKRAKDGSDTLLIFLLKARRPDKFKDRFESATTVTHRFADLDDAGLDTEIAGLIGTLRQGGKGETAH